MMKQTTVRFEEPLLAAVEAMAKSKGMPTSLLIREFVERGVNEQNVLTDHIVNESILTQALLKRIEAVVIGHMHFSTVISPGADKSEFRKTLERGQKVAELLNKEE